MFNLGFTHLILLGVIALIVVGPEQLPDLAKKLAVMLNDLRRAKDEILGPVSQIQNETQKMMEETKAKATQEIQTLLEMQHKLEEQIRNQGPVQAPTVAESTVAAVPATPLDQVKKDPDGKPS